MDRCLDLIVQGRSIKIHIDFKFLAAELLMQALQVKSGLHMDSSIIVTQLISSFQGCIEQAMQGKSEGWWVTFDCLAV